MATVKEKQLLKKEKRKEKKLKRQLKRKEAQKEVKIAKIKKNVGKGKQQGNKKVQGSKKFVKVLASGLKVDTRDVRLGDGAGGSSINNELSTVSSNIPFDVTTDGNVFYGPVMALISYACQKGFGAATESNTNPFYAFGFLSYLLMNAAQNQIPSSLSVPKCVAFWAQSLTTKTIPMLGGHVTYKFDFTLPSTVPSSLALGPEVDVLWSLCVPTSNLVNNLWPIGDSGLQYDPQLGSIAWQSLVQMLTQTNLEENGMMKMVSLSAHNKMSTDPSSYAVVLSDPGGGFNSTGAFGKLVYNEVFVRYPLFTVFNSNPSSTISLNRYANKPVNFAGDGLLLGATCSFIKEKWLGFKNPPKFKCIDLNEFVEVYALVLQKAITLAVNDPQTQTTFLTGATQGSLETYLTSIYQCPLNLQEFTLLLRNVMMNLLKDTQPFVQSIYPRSSPTSGANLFQALAAGTNCCPLPGSTGMMIPSILAENMRANTYRVKEINAVNPQFYLPVLGAYSQDQLNSSDYTVTATFPSSTFSPITFNVFAPDPTSTISIFDGATSDGNPNFINDVAALNMLTAVFNNWLKGDSQLASFICTLDQLGTDGGLDILTNMNNTAYWVPYSEDQENMSLRRKYWEDYEKYLKDKGNPKGKAVKPVPGYKMNIHEQRFGIKDFGMRHLDLSPYATRNIVGITFAIPPYASVWETVQQWFIKPIINSVVETGQQSSNQIYRIAAQQREGNILVPSNSSTSNNNLAYYHDQFASLMVGGRNAERKAGVIEEMFAQMRKEGNGSIFSDIAGSFARGATAGALVGLGSLMPRGVIG